MNNPILSWSGGELDGTLQNVVWDVVDANLGGSCQRPHGRRDVVEAARLRTQCRTPATRNLQTSLRIVEKLSTSERAMRMPRSWSMG
jgi:hypothetical protein